MTYWILLTDMYYAAPELWYTLGGGVFCLITIIFLEILQILKLKQKNYFLNRDRERYAETLYASRDGYFAFIYPDQKVNDPRQYIVERCSRRLAVIMNLPNGALSSFDDILKNFYKDDAKKIQKYVDLLREEGVSFDDDFALKNINKYLHLAGTRINGIDGNIYCDMIWFRDISFETAKINNLEKAKKQASEQFEQMHNMIDNLPYPVWLRNDRLQLINYNKKYLEIYGETKKAATPLQNAETTTANDDINLKELAKKALVANRQKCEEISIINNGERIAMKVIETPFYAEATFDKIYTLGTMVDVNELDEIKRNLKLHQNAQLEILGTLGTAFAVFDQKFKLAFYNHAFEALWKLDANWLENNPSYTAFLDIIREKRLLPEVPDYVMFKADEQKKFHQIIEPQKDMLHLPNGRTLSRMRAAYPAGGLIFAYEDITDRLAATSAYNALLTGQKEMLENLFDAVLIFGTNGRLAFYNSAYLTIWQANKYFLENEPSLDEILESQQSFFEHVENWQQLKTEISEHILSMTTKIFVLSRKDRDIKVSSCNLSDGSMMITYQNVSVFDNESFI